MRQLFICTAANPYSRAAFNMFAASIAGDIVPLVKHPDSAVLSSAPATATGARWRACLLCGVEFLSDELRCPALARVCEQIEGAYVVAAQHGLRQRVEMRAAIRQWVEGADQLADNEVVVTETAIAALHLVATSPEDWRDIFYAVTEALDDRASRLRESINASKIVIIGRAALSIEDSPKSDEEILRGIVNRRERVGEVEHLMMVFLKLCQARIKELLADGVECFACSKELPRSEAHQVAGFDGEEFAYMCAGCYQSTAEESSVAV